MHVRIATCKTLPEPDVDEQLLLDALAARGLRPKMVAWDDEDAAWDEAVPTVIRSTWNYIHDLGGFMAWIERVSRAAPLWNPADVVHWNAHKSYLADLGARHVPVVPTAFYPRGAVIVDFDADLAQHGFGEVVVKPTVGAGSWSTRRFAATHAARVEAAEFLRGLVAERDAMVQAYVPSVEGYGERSVVWIDVEITHAMSKSPRFSGQDEAVTGPVEVADDERRLAERALAPWTERLLYARVDLARDHEGRPMVMELELIEPSLFLLQHPPALERLVAGILSRVG
jgi:glutathione synthase/RimK-type ligase-like ATP-grasp enzyme